MRARLWALFWIAFWSLSPAWGQRVFATVDPADLDPELRFDTNELPIRDAVQPGAAADLNFSPNLVLTPDSQRAFVSYPASDKVMVFNPRSGEILGLVEVGDNPALLTLSPDGTRVAVVSLFLKDNLPQLDEDFQGKRIGAISIIEVETLEVRTLQLEGVFFSFANNVVFSQDGKTGFVASSGTDQILRFEVESATEITPRLEMLPATRPSSLTMAPDFSFFTVVLAGSSGLAQQDVPDSIKVIDPATFSVVREIVPRVDAGVLPHNFFSTNTMAISEDGRLGLITDQETSARSTFPIFARDHAILMDLQTGEILQVFDVGGRAGVSLLLPNGKAFVVISGAEFSVIDIASREVISVVPVQADVQITTRPAITRDSRRMFVTCAVNDLLMEIDLERGAVRRSVALGPRVERESDGTTFTVPAAPINTALTSDESVLVVLKFNANTIELLQDSQRFLVPLLLSTEEWFSGVALTNTDLEGTEIIARSRSRSGFLLADDLTTEEVMEVVNPGVIELEAGHQLALTAAEILQAAPGVQFEAWLDLDSSRFQVNGIYLTGDHALRRLDGGASVFETHTTLILPEARTGDGFRTEIAIVNPNGNFNDAELSLVRRSGEVVETVSRRIPPTSILNLPLRDPVATDVQMDGIFSEASFTDFEGGYVVLTSPQGLTAVERYFDEQRLAALPGIPIPRVLEELPRRLFFPHVTTLQGSETFLSLIHRGADPATVTVFLKGDGGQDLASPARLEIQPNQALRRPLSELFALSGPSGVTGWLLVETDRAGLVGSVELQILDRALTALPLEGGTRADLIFSQVVQGSGISTGVALLNPGEATASLTLELRSPEGVLRASQTLSLPAGHRDARLLNELFPALPETTGGYLRVIGDRGIAAAELFFADDLEFLTAVPPQAVAP